MQRLEVSGAVRLIYSSLAIKGLSQHLNTNTILVTEEYGFSKGISNEDAAFGRTDSVTKSINQKMYVGGIFSDLAKAFYCVKQDILLASLHFYGIQGVTEDCFWSYLTSRRQKVEV